MRSVFWRVCHCQQPFTLSLSEQLLTMLECQCETTQLSLLEEGEVPGAVTPLSTSLQHQKPLTYSKEYIHYLPNFVKLSYMKKTYF